MAFEAIDWQRPWLEPLRETGEMLTRSDDWVAAANAMASARGLYNPAGLPIVFVPQQDLPAGTPYEAHIAATGHVPTRDNLHDFFNALIWLHFPQTKCELNGLHRKAAAQPVQPGTRGSQRDAATLFDENSAIFVSTEVGTLNALQRRDWKGVLLKPPADFHDSCQVVLFGHALLEKLVSPYKSITAHVWTCSVDKEWMTLPPARRLADLDARIAEGVRGGFTSADFCHLPVLGVPGWWPAQDEAFYGDAEVFRPPRAASRK